MKQLAIQFTAGIAGTLIAILFMWFNLHGLAAPLITISWIVTLHAICMLGVKVYNYYTNNN